MSYGKNKNKTLYIIGGIVVTIVIAVVALPKATKEKIRLLFQKKKTGV